MKYKYDGRGERLVREEDFAALGVEHSDVYFNEDNDHTQELTEEAAKKLCEAGEPLSVLRELDDESVEGSGEEEPTEEPVKKSGRRVKDQPQA